MSSPILPGLGIRPIPRRQWPAGLPREELFDKLLIWKLPQRGHRYVLSADISDGIGEDRSVADIYDVGTLTYPDEQVAQYITSGLDPVGFAGVLDAMGNLYVDDDKEPALCAIENNNHGMACQTHLQHHWGYDNLFIWQAYDKRRQRAQYSNSYGWQTNFRTRPMILTYFHRALNTKDAITGKRDVIINSPHTIAELPDFEAPQGGQLWQAEGNPHDDCIMTAAIGIWVCQTIHFGENEPMAEARRRRAEEEARKIVAAGGVEIDKYNTDWSEEEIAHGVQDEWNDAGGVEKPWW
jgi:hypothetical protein